MEVSRNSPEIQTIKINDQLELIKKLSHEDLKTYLEPFKIKKWLTIALFAIRSPCKFGGIINKDFRSKLIANLYELGYKNLEKHPR
ncbi:hypothetical protein B0E43_09790 [Algoriphagus sp. A40]|nr:hypothetical protein B0E43_09790 [Algoriphagus sp. A40]